VLRSDLIQGLRAIEIAIEDSHILQNITSLRDIVTRGRESNLDDINLQISSSLAIFDRHFYNMTQNTTHILDNFDLIEIMDPNWRGSLYSFLHSNKEKSADLYFRVINNMYQKLTYFVQYTPKILYILKREDDANIDPPDTSKNSFPQSDDDILILSFPEPSKSVDPERIASGFRSIIDL
jgi:hypothetical protein